MKKIIQISSLLLSLLAFYMKGVQMSSHTPLSKLYSIEAVPRELKSEMVYLADLNSAFALVVGLISLSLAIAARQNKLCGKTAGTLLIIFAALSVLCSRCVM